MYKQIHVSILNLLIWQEFRSKGNNRYLLVINYYKFESIVLLVTRVTSVSYLRALAFGLYAVGSEGIVSLRRSNTIFGE